MIVLKAGEIFHVVWFQWSDVSSVILHVNVCRFRFPIGTDSLHSRPLTWRIYLESSTRNVILRQLCIPRIQQSKIILPYSGYKSTVRMVILANMSPVWRSLPILSSTNLWNYLSNFYFPIFRKLDDRLRRERRLRTLRKTWKRAKNFPVCYSKQEFLQWQRSLAAIINFSSCIHRVLVTSDEWDGGQVWKTLTQCNGNFRRSRQHRAIFFQKQNLTLKSSCNWEIWSLNSATAFSFSLTWFLKIPTLATKYSNIWFSTVYKIAKILNKVFVSVLQWIDSALLIHQRERRSQHEKLGQLSYLNHN